MDFRTTVSIPQNAVNLGVGDGVVMLGSCFAENVGAKLKENKFRCSVNPFGVLYNPMSIAQSLELLLDGNMAKCDDMLFERGGLWHSWLHSSKFSAETREECCDKIRTSFDEGVDVLCTARALIITFGTNRCYNRMFDGHSFTLEGGHSTLNEHSFTHNGCNNVLDESNYTPDRHSFIRNEDNRMPDGGSLMVANHHNAPGGRSFTVANCHKVPEKEFDVYDVSVEEIVRRYSVLLDKLFAANADIQVIFTVSPYRYAKYGMHGSALSKAVLLLATDELVRRYAPRCCYFPSYEIMNDELRDYRFYAPDMLHPSGVAVDYIFERFAEFAFSPEMSVFMPQWQRVVRDMNHRPLHAQSAEYRIFLQKTRERVMSLSEKYANLAVSSEIAELDKRLQGT